MQRICALLAFGAMLVGEAPAQEDTGPASFWRRELAAHRSLGGASVPHGVGRSSLGARRAPEPPAAAVVVASPTPPAKPFEERLTALRTKIQGTEARLLYSTASEERALAYNATRKAELRTLGGALVRRGAERETLLRELSAEYRALPSISQRESWMQTHRALVVSELGALVDARRRNVALDEGIAEIDATDERLRRLIEKKQGDQRRYGTHREEAFVEESLRVELPVAATREPAVDLTAEELRLLQELFPAR